MSTFGFFQDECFNIREIDVAHHGVLTQNTQHLEIMCSKHDLKIYVKLCFESTTLVDVAYTHHIHWSVYNKALDIICNLSFLLLQSRDATFRSHMPTGSLTSVLLAHKNFPYLSMALQFPYLVWMRQQQREIKLKNDVCNLFPTGNVTNSNHLLLIFVIS